jgi:hypothetical protein
MEIKSLGYVSESSSSWGYDQRGFEMARYDFRLTEMGERMAARKAEADPVLWDSISKAAAIVKQAGDLDYMELSIAAKAYYVLRELKGVATIEDIAAMLPKFGWKVTPEQLDKATEFLSRTNLVARTLVGAA